MAGFAALPAQYKRKALAPLLQDPVRAVRTEAARVLVSVPQEQFSEIQQKSLRSALAEYRAAQLAVSDVLPGAYLNLAVLETNLGNTQKAEQYYRKAMEIDPDFLPARVNLANLFNRQQRNEEAEQVLKEAIERAAGEGELHYSLGLLLAEENRLADAAGALGKAAQLLPQRPRVQYNYALALQHLGRIEQAEKALRKAYRLDRTNPEVLQALVILYSQQKRWDEAYPYAKQLAQLYPDAPGPRQMLEQLNALRKYGVRQ